MNGKFPVDSKNLGGRAICPAVRRKTHPARLERGEHVFAPWQGELRQEGFATTPLPGQRILARGTSESDRRSPPRRRTRRGWIGREAAGLTPEWKQALDDAPRDVLIAALKRRDDLFHAHNAEAEHE